jgi:hypothetical protein
MSLIIRAEGIMQHEAASKIKCTKAIPLTSQGRNTNGTAQVQPEDLEDTNMLISRLTRDITDVRLPHGACLTKV